MYIIMLKIINKNNCFKTIYKHITTIHKNTFVGTHLKSRNDFSKILVE